MDERLTPEELRSLLGAFALGAVDTNEREEVERFVLDDHDARTELHQLEHAVAWLGHASPRPTAASWDAVRAEMNRDLLGAVPSNVSELRAPRAPEIGQRTLRGRGAWRRVTAIAAAAALVVGISIAVAGVIDSDSTTRTATAVALRAPDGVAVVNVRVDPDGKGSIAASTLPAAPAGHEYQLWTQPSAEAPMKSAGLLGRAPHAGRPIHVPKHSARFAISIEPIGGSSAPTTDPVAISALGVL